MPDRIKVVITGVCGRLGQAILKGIINEPDILVAAAVDINFEGTDIGILAGTGPCHVFVEKDLKSAIERSQPDMLLEFTNPASVMQNIRTAVENRVSCVIGTTGMTPEDLDEAVQLSKQYETSIFIAPNFALGAVLMMKFSQEASRYFPSVEIIEKHHDQKLDAPSGTAVKTMELIAEEREKIRQGAAGEFEKINGSRGGEFQGMRVHSVRLPGFVAHQEVIFGGDGQTLTIKHDTVNRECFVPGVLLAIRNLSNLKGVVYGLEKLLW